jgi:hypothetical protein
MSANRKELESQLEEYGEKLKSLKSYIREMKARAEEHGTDRSLFEGDLFEAEHNVAYYEGEVGRLRGALGGAGGGPTSGGGSSLGGVLGGALPQTLNQGVGTLLLSTLCFAAGVLIGSRLLSNRGDD